MKAETELTATPIAITPLGLPQIKGTHPFATVRTTLLPLSANRTDAKRFIVRSETYGCRREMSFKSNVF